LTHIEARQLLVRGLIDRQVAGSFTLTDEGHAVLKALLMRAGSVVLGWAHAMQPIYRPPMTLGNMRTNDARSLAVSCLLPHHQAVLAVDAWPDCVAVPFFGPRMVCTSCGIIGADARPNWSERPVRPSLSGVQWR